MAERFCYTFNVLTMHSNDKGMSQANAISNAAVICGLSVILLSWSHTYRQYDYYCLGLEGTRENYEKFKCAAYGLGAVVDVRD